LKLDDVSAAIENILQQQLLPPPDSLGTALDGRLKSIEELVATLNDQLPIEFRDLASKFNLHDEEMKKMVEGVMSELQAVRNFQDLSVHEAQRYPFLFIISEEKLKEGLQGTFVQGMRESLYQHYCVHFACNVCGAIAMSGSRKPKDDDKKDFWQLAREKFSVVDHQQGGYRLTVMRKSVAQFLKYAHIILSLLDLGAKLAGVSLSQVVSTVSHELNIADDMRRLAKAIEDEKWIPEPIQKAAERVLVPDDDDDDKKNGGDDDVADSDLSDSDISDVESGQDNNKDDKDKAGLGVKLDGMLPDSDNRDKLRAVKGSGGGVKTKEEIRAEWASTNHVTITLGHIKMAKELLRLVGDQEGDDTGLKPCYRSDGTCAWVCPGDGPGTCHQQFLDEGYKGCLASLEHLLPKKK
jgi:hypothetical protein